MATKRAPLPEPELVSIAQAARIVGLSETTFRNRVLHTGVPVTQIGGRKLVRLATLRQWAASQEPETTPDRPRRPVWLGYQPPEWPGAIRRRRLRTHATHVS